MNVALLVSVLAALAGCASGAPEPQRCAADAECPAGSRCTSGVCVADAPPSTALALPGAPLQTNVILTFDASATADPDPGDAVVSFAWTFRTVSGASCAAPTVAGTWPLAKVRFACPGRYAVDVTATDEMGVAATATREFDVQAGPTLVTTGPDFPLGHGCTAAPLCAPDGSIELSATTEAQTLGTVSYAWTVEPPPDRALGPNRRVTFSPDASAVDPTATLETDGQAISGDWIFRVVVSDDAGVIGTAATRVSIGNRPPVVEATIPTPDHAFDESQLTASGEIPFTITDPDGDPLLEPTVEWRHSGDGAGTFTGLLLKPASKVTFSIAVPYAAREDAAHLIGGAGLERTIVFAAVDVNGAGTPVSWPILVGNRPPELVSEPGPSSVGHSYDPIALAYVADVPLSTWGDPDGDPLFTVAGTSTGDPECAELVLPTGSGVARASCRLPYTGTPAVGNLARTHVVAQAVQDPWTAAAATSTASFSILNQSPVVSSGALGVPASCHPVTCCRNVDGECAEWEGDIPARTLNVASRWSDPDGDPLDVQLGSSRATCADASCTVPLELPPIPDACGIMPLDVAMTVSDGASTAGGTLHLSRSCMAP